MSPSQRFLCFDVISRRICLLAVFLNSVSVGRPIPEQPPTGACHDAVASSVYFFEEFIEGLTLDLGVFNEFVCPALNLSSGFKLVTEFVAPRT
jgi:hypothetical protein